jgi:hypothetical protein
MKKSRLRILKFELIKWIVLVTQLAHIQLNIPNLPFNRAIKTNYTSDTSIQQTIFYGQA